LGFVCGVSAAFFLLEVLTGVSAAFVTDLTLAGDFGSFFFVDFLPLVGDSGASSFGDLALDDMFARLRGDGARARVGRGVVMVVEVFACGRGASWVWGARVLNLGARRYRGTVGVDAGACGLGGSRRTWFCWVSCAGNVGGDFWACAALGRQRSAPQRAVGVRKAWLRARGRTGSL
jgi:hypothetical protein